jgi:hypothetical protein
MPLELQQEWKSQTRTEFQAGSVECIDSRLLMTEVKDGINQQKRLIIK